MRFRTWITRKYIDDKSAKGTLARAIKADYFYFPQARGYENIIKYLVCKKASDNCIRAFNECWEEYVKCEKKL